MSKFKGVKVSNGVFKRLMREAGPFIFHREDKDGQRYVKAALTHGAEVMRSYGLNPEGNYEDYEF